MPERLFTDGVKYARQRTEASLAGSFLANAGFSSRLSMLVISLGNSTKTISISCERMPKRTDMTVARVLRVKVRHCCRVWLFAAFAGAA
jgi:hypothetical protein